MKERVIDFIHRLLVYDYLLFGGIALLFILLMVMAVFFRHRTALAVTIVVISFIVLTVGPVVGYIQLHKYLFMNTVTVTEVKKLEFTEALLIRGSINNRSKRSFQECTLQSGVYKVTHNRYIDPLYPFIPFKKESMSLNAPIKSGESKTFKLFVEPFRYTKDFNITIKAECR